MMLSQCHIWMRCLQHCQAISIFSRLDLSKGYWQVPLTHSALPFTAIQTPLGLFLFTKMPFGLITAPATFCRHA